ncbi:hypothetical protein PUN28_009116 [Cardiocondyla obscurior]|uniref:Uncharacterized protein n=1 Tax=Cardiocondyla obscurior TaxID=286306 RepID=A0AAW2FWD5_9HYME
MLRRHHLDTAGVFVALNIPRRKFVLVQDLVISSNCCLKPRIPSSKTRGSVSKCKNVEITGIRISAQYYFKRTYLFNEIAGPCKL